MPPKRNQQPIWVQLVDLFLMELTNWRWSWRSAILTGMVAPILSIVALGIFARDSGKETLAYILTGNVVLSLMFENLSKVSSRFTYMRFMGTLDYFATLPINRYSLVIAIVLSFLLLSLPSLIVTICFGSFFLNVPITLNPVIFIVIPFCAIPLAGIGALIGSNARTPQEADSFSLLATMVMLFIGPVIIPGDRLPNIMLLIGHLSPATYAASALRQTLLEPLNWQIIYNLAALVGLSIVFFWIASLKMDWRQN